MMANRQRARKERTSVRREQIVHAALELIGREGVKGLTIKGVSVLVGVVPSGIYRHYSGKSAILSAVFDYLESSLLSNVEAVYSQSACAEDRLYRLYRRHLALVHERPGIPRLLFSDESASPGGGCRRRLYEIIESYRSGVERIMREGQLSGRIRSDVSPATMSLLFLGMIQSAAILRHVSAGAFSPASQADASWRLFRRAIAPVAVGAVGCDEREESGYET